MKRPTGAAEQDGGWTRDWSNRLNAAIVAAMTNPGMREQLQNEGAMPVGNSATEFAAFVRDDVQRWAPIVKQSGARPD